MARIITPLLFLLTLLIALISLHIGSTSIAVFSGLSDWLNNIASPAAVVMGEIRLPRTLLALAVGAALGLSGATLQGLLRNPLADPGLTGASQGAALGAAAVFYFALLPWAGIYAPTIAALLGAFITLLLMLWLAGNAGSHMVILAGLAISTVSGALLAAVLNFAPNPYAMQELVFWLLGSVSDRDLNYLWVMIPALIIGFSLIWSQRRLLLALSLGERVANSMGLSYRRGSRLLVLGSALLVGTAVAVAGGIGFIGLIVPHLVRPLVNNRPDKILIPAMLLGAMLVCAADIAVRFLPLGRELKLGVITALIGAPLFIWLVWKERKQWSF